MLPFELVILFGIGAAALPFASNQLGIERGVSSLYPSERASTSYAVQLGVASSTSLVNEIALGFLPDFTETSISAMNAVLPKPMAVVGDYLSVTPDDLFMGNLQWHRDDLVNQKSKPVYMATIMPTDGLSSWDSTQADAVAEAMAALNADGVPTWVRFAYEMNGCPAWNAWGCDPDGFKKAWGIMSASLKAKAPEARMMWAPNVDPTTWVGMSGNYAEYYPGDDTVDLVGMSLYSFGNGQQNNTMPGTGFLPQSVTPFYNVYSKPNGKPFVIAETSAPFHYDTNTLTPAPGGASEYGMKTQWLTSLTGSATHQLYPNMVAAVWFNFKKNERDQTIDFRALLGNSEVQGAVAALVG